MRDLRFLGTLLIVFLLCIQAIVQAKVASITLEAITNSSDVIALATVEKVTTIAGVRVAQAIVVRAIKGTADKERLAFVAQPTWTCDISEANVDDKVLLFLRKLPSEPMQFIDNPKRLASWVPERLGKDIRVFVIAHSGRGRMPLRKVNAEDYVSLWAQDVKLPATLKSIEGPDQQLPWVRSVALSDMEQYVKGLCGEKTSTK